MAERIRGEPEATYNIHGTGFISAIREVLFVAPQDGTVILEVGNTEIFLAATDKVRFTAVKLGTVFYQTPYALAISAQALKDFGDKYEKELGKPGIDCQLVEYKDKLVVKNKGKVKGEFSLKETSSLNWRKLLEGDFEGGVQIDTQAAAQAFDIFERFFYVEMGTIKQDGVTKMALTQDVIASRQQVLNETGQIELTPRQYRPEQLRELFKYTRHPLLLVQRDKNTGITIFRGGNDDFVHMISPVTK